MTSQYEEPDEDCIAGYMAKFIGKKHIQGDDIPETDGFTYHGDPSSSYRIFWDKPEEPTQRFVISGIHDLDATEVANSPVNDDMDAEKAVVSIYPLRSEVEVECDSRAVQGVMKVRFGVGPNRAKLSTKQDVADDLYGFVLSIVEGRSDDTLEQWQKWEKDPVYEVVNEEPPEDIDSADSPEV